MSKRVYQREEVRWAPRQFGKWDDFEWFISPHMWTSVFTGTGTNAGSDAHGGILVMTPSAADNDENYIKSTNEVFLMDADNVFWAGCLLKYTEVATNAANVAFGFMNAVAADSMLDNGAGPAASFSGAVIYKVDGSLFWQCCSSVGTTRTNTLTTVSSVSSGYQLLEIEIKPISLTDVRITYFISTLNTYGGGGFARTQVLSQTGVYGQPLEHTLDATSATEMNLFVCTKNGTAVAQPALVDGIGYEVLR